jgi:hypothetical protein
MALFVRPPQAQAAALTSVNWSVSNTQTSATGIAYAFSFKAATTGNIGIVTMTVPTGTAGTPAVAANYGVPAGTIGLAGTTLTYTVTSPINVRAGAPVYIEVSGLTNTGTAGSYSSSVTTKTSGGTTIDGPTTSNSNNFSSGGTTTTIAVAKSTVFSIDTNSFNLVLDPATNSSATQTINIGVSSNARNGYTLNCRVNQQPTGSSALSAFTSGMASAAAWGGATNPGSFGYSMAVTNNGSSGSPAAGGSLSGTNFAGFTTSGENCGSASSRTGNPLGTDLSGCGVGLCASAAHAWTTQVKAVADFNTPADIYTATITYTVTPSY